MDEEIETLLVAVRADTAGFARDIGAKREALDGPLPQGAQRAGSAIDAALGRALRSGRIGFDDLKRHALAAMGEIAAGSIRAGIGAVAGGQSLGSIATSLVGALLGSPGRATGGPVAPGRAYMVGERGPELFVPTASGRIETGPSGAREVRVRIDLHAPQGSEARGLAQSSRQVAREVKRALMRVE